MALCAINKNQDFINFIDEEKITKLASATSPSPARVREVIAKSLSKQALDLEETAVLLTTEDKELVEEIFDAARKLKRDVYGNRIVLFAPLYIGNDCVNDCAYCAFKRSNTDAVRRTLSPAEISAQVKALEDKGHKRLILVFGEHPKYDAKFIADTARHVYTVKSGHGEIRRVNVNAAPLDFEGFKIVKEAGIGTYQIFQETYHQETYGKYHPANTRKGDYLWRLNALHVAMKAGCDDVGIGVLFGLHDWKFEVMSLVAHALDLQKRCGVGPHTISFPRLQPAQQVELGDFPLVNDYDFKRIIAILRLAVPYTGLILTAREKPQLRREVMEFGVSQIDAGSRIELGGYTEAGDAQVMEREQFSLGDIRSLDEVMRELMADGNVPSFCTSCYRLGRTGEHFMEFAIPGFIQDFCTPNALCTLMEYLEDYACDETKQTGLKLIESELAKMKDETRRAEVQKRLKLIRENDQRDLYF